LLLPALLLFSLALGVSGCGGKQLEPTRVTTTPPYSACLQYCSDLTDESAFVRDGCRRGCELTLALFPLRGSHYATRANCEEGVNSLDTDAALAALARRCAGTWEGQDRRDGCERAGAAFYEAVSVNLCRSDMP
jgi:hypothetical protein